MELEPTGKEGILLTREGSKLTIKLNNPALRNRLSSDDISFLRRVIADVNADTDIRVVILTGTGKCFCSGFDLAELEGLSNEGRLPDFDLLTDDLEHLRCPVICAINGGVYGGAIDLALACDFRIGAAEAELLMPAARFGLHYYPNGIRRYVSRLGMSAAKRLLLLAEPVAGETLVAIGFLDEVVNAEGLQARVNEIAALVQNNAPLPVEGMKKVINMYANGQADEALARGSFERSLQSEDLKKGIQSIKLKKPAVFNRE